VTHDTRGANGPEPAPHLDTAALFAPLGRELLSLLGGLLPADWERPTVCPGWTVRDVAAHLLDTALRRISAGRDGHRPPGPPAPITSYGELVAFLNGLNRDWVVAMRRISPALLVELLALAEPPLAAFLTSLDGEAPAAIGVAWAGEERSAVWFDVARELTERWHHQQQIRLAVGAPPLDDPSLSGPVLETFLRALPHRYRDVSAAPGTSLGIRIAGRETYPFSLVRQETGWTLCRGEAVAPAASIALSEETAWLLLTKGLAPEPARAQADVAGDEALAAPFFGTLAVMA